MAQSIEISSTSESETESIGQSIGALLRPGIVIGLVGTLGSGKTRLTQAIAKSIGVEQAVVSPTYTICIPYEAKLKLLHMDAYRIEHDEEVDELDLFERVEDGEILIVEWADRVEHLIPKPDLVVTLTPTGENDRRLLIEAKSQMGESIVELLASAH